MRQIDQLSKGQVKRLLGSKEGIKALVKRYFYDDKGNDLELTDYQADIVHRLVLKEPKRVMLWAVTRGGKSYALAIGAILVAVFRPGETIRVIGPTKNHSKIIMNYIQRKIPDHPDIVETVSVSKGKSDPEKLQDELSQNRITFENKSEISVLSASVSSQGRQLIGKGGSLIIVDECERIPEDIVRSKIMRMVGEQKNAQIFLVSNPTMPDNRGFMYEEMRRDQNRDDRWHKIRIPWQKAVDQDRLTKDFIMEEKERMTRAEFTIWYEAEYPEEVEGGLIRQSWIGEAVNKNLEVPEDITPSSIYGLDVAGEGNDYTVLTQVSKWKKDGSLFYKTANISRWDLSSTSQVANRVDSVTHGQVPINVDAIGIGKGVGDKLRDKGNKVNLVKVSESPSTSELKDRFRDKKAQYYWRLREAFEESRIDIEDNKDLRDELRRLQYDFTSRGKIRIDNSGKSPDYADSLMLAIGKKKPAEMGVMKIKPYG